VDGSSGGDDRRVAAAVAAQHRDGGELHRRCRRERCGDGGVAGGRGPGDRLQRGLLRGGDGAEDARRLGGAFAEQGALTRRHGTLRQGE
jgi:hypothetical protein